MNSGLDVFYDAAIDLDWLPPAMIPLNEPDNAKPLYNKKLCISMTDFI